MSRRLLQIVCVVPALAACGEPDVPPENGQDPTDPPGFTSDGPCASDEALIGTLGECDDTFPACGGDLTGTWVVDDWCTDPSAPGGTGTTTIDDLHCEGDVWQEIATWASTLNFVADGTLDTVSVIDADLSWQVPSDCLYQLAAESCDSLGTAYDMVCTTESDGGCSCQSTVHLAIEGETTWTACEGRLDIAEFSAAVTGTNFGLPYTGTTTQGPYETDYCIDGDTVRIVSAPFELGGFYRRP